MAVEIREVETHAEASLCVHLQSKVWHFSARDIVSEEMLLACRRGGGIVLGAWSDAGRMIGFVFSLPAPLGRRVIQHSHMLAVDSQWRDRGIGRLLKEAQFEAARQRGADCITWTFDPLEARNAYLNLEKLGAVADRYYVNLYGESTSSALHAGLGTDRLLAEWWIKPPGSRPCGGKTSLKQALQWPQTIAVDFPASLSGYPRPGKVRLRLRAERLALEVPARIQRLKTRFPELARLWRESTRSVFLNYLKRGYRAGGVLLCRDQERQQRRVFYCLIQTQLPQSND